MPRHETAAPDLVDITLDIGAVHIIAGPADEASVTINPSDPERAPDVEAAEDAEVEFRDGRLVIRATELRGLRKLVGPGSRTGAVEVVVEVPEGVAVVLAAQVASVRVDGRLGRTEIRTQIGDLHLDDVGDTTAKTSSGDVIIGRISGDARVQGAGMVRIRALTGPAEVKNLDGAVEIGSADGPSRVRSSNGDLTIDRTAGDLHARTAHGAITVGEAAAGSLDLRTPAGTIRVGVPEGTSAFLDATSKLGRVEQHLTDVDGPDPAHRRTHIQAHTGMGDVVLVRA